MNLIKKIFLLLLIIPINKLGLKDVQKVQKKSRQVIKKKRLLNINVEIVVIWVITSEIVIIF
jgi:hypothetical protein